MLAPIPLVVPHGSSRTWRLRFGHLEDGTLVPEDFTGWGIGLVIESPALEPHLAIAWTAIAAGQASLVLAAAPDLAMVPHRFRIRRVPPGSGGGATRALVSRAFVVVPS